MPPWPPEAPVLAADDGGDQRRGNTGKRHPVEFADADVGTAQVEQAAVAVEQPGFARMPGGADGGVVGRWGGAGGDEEQQDRCEQGGKHDDSLLPPLPSGEGERHAPLPASEGEGAIREGTRFAARSLALPRR